MRIEDNPLMAAVAENLEKEATFVFGKPRTTWAVAFESMLRYADPCRQYDWKAAEPENVVNFATLVFDASLRNYWGPDWDSVSYEMMVPEITEHILQPSTGDV